MKIRDGCFASEGEGSLLTCAMTGVFFSGGKAADFLSTSMESSSSEWSD